MRRRGDELTGAAGGRSGRVFGKGEASSRHTLPFELLHGYSAEWSVDFHYCILSLGAIGLEKMPRR